MMITITLARKETEQGAVIHQFRNFGEDVFRWLRDRKGAGEVDIGEIDRSTGTFAIRGVKAEMSRQVLHWLEQEAERQHMPISLDVRQ